MESKTTISISKVIRDQLVLLGNKDSTFDDIIQMLLEKWSENQ